MADGPHIGMRLGGGSQRMELRQSLKMTPRIRMKMQPHQTVEAAIERARADAARERKKKKG